MIHQMLLSEILLFAIEVATDDRCFMLLKAALLRSFVALVQRSTLH